MKKTFLSELAYVFGLLTLTLGTALTERADFGMSMVVAPAYLLHLKLSEFWAWFSFGTAEYCIQLLLIVLLTLYLRKMEKGYPLSFLTAVLYGVMLDGQMRLIPLLPGTGLGARCGFFVSGMLLCCLGVALMLHTYLSPEAYELVVKELAEKSGKDVTKIKTVYDLCSLAVSVALSFAFFGFGRFVGVGVGTAVSAVCSGWIIGKISDWLEGRFEFRDLLPWREFFEN